jgi:hypothetical protein
MKLIPRSLKWRTILLTVWVLTSVFGTVWYFYGRDIEQHIARGIGNYRLRDSEDAVVRGFARGEFGPGSSVVELIEKHPPSHVKRWGRFTNVTYEDVFVVAMNGKLLCAIGPEGHTFFDQMRGIHLKASINDLNQEMNKNDQERERKWIEHCVQIHWSVAGVGAVQLNFDNHPDPAHPDK